MDTSKVILALSALAQDTRLQVFRLLMTEGAEGLPATEIANRLGVRQNLMSTHLNILAAAGLTNFRRDGRRILHAVDIETTRDLMSFLVQDCCNGHPEACASLLDAAIGKDGRAAINR
ncbi:MAG: ArsR/SmtB family transcription factor [Parvularculaceae bacterium]